MDLVALIALWYLGGAAALGAVLLLGQRASPTSCLGRLYYCLASGPCDAATWCVRCTCGERGVGAMDAAGEYLCDKPNPVLQLLYSALLGGGYYIYSLTLFPLLPGPYVSDIHVHTGTATLLLCFTLLCMCSVSDPGTVTPASSDALAAAFDHGDQPAAPRKDCNTCGLRRPARTKHCPTCGRCVARFDHHCGWINNCVGLHNLRLFVLFLAANTFLCFYAIAVGVLAIWGDMERRGAFRAAVMDYATAEVVYLGRDWRYLFRFLLRHFHMALTLSVFLLCMGVTLAGFLGYHLWLISINSTTYERIKRGRATAGEAPPSYSRGLAANITECLAPELFLKRSHGEKRT